MCQLVRRSEDSGQYKRFGIDLTAEAGLGWDTGVGVGLGWDTGVGVGVGVGLGVTENKWWVGGLKIIENGWG